MALAIAHSRGLDGLQAPPVLVEAHLANGLPIFTLVAYAFNSGTSIAVWEGVSLHWFGKAWENEAVKSATLRSLTIASLAALLIGI